KENEEYMAPYLKELGIRTKLWLVPQMGHSLPGPDVLAGVHAWLTEDLERRRKDAKDRPGLSVAPDEAPDAVKQAERQFAVAEADLKREAGAWRGVALLQGITSRWPKTPS